mmetsp:Transcript_27362/g.63125  ORF Transcript_27362/g.63125 Transcript_27362/m.63125 type:complete len:240 (-) Transcript_27362:354-1073(-)
MRQSVRFRVAQVKEILSELRKAHFNSQYLWSTFWPQADRIRAQLATRPLQHTPCPQVEQELVHWACHVAAPSLHHVFNIADLPLCKATALMWALGSNSKNTVLETKECQRVATDMHLHTCSVRHLLQGRIVCRSESSGFRIAWIACQRSTGRSGFPTFCGLYHASVHLQRTLRSSSSGWCSALKLDPELLLPDATVRDVVHIHTCVTPEDLLAFRPCEHPLLLLCMAHPLNGLASFHIL